MTNVIKAYNGKGQVILEIPHKDGLVDGTVINSDSPATHLETEYVKGIKNGMHRAYYTNPRALYYEIRYKDGNENGTQRWYYRSGNLSESTDWKDGERHGISVSFDNNGELFSKYHFLYGKHVAKEEYREHELIEELAKL